MTEVYDTFGKVLRLNAPDWYKREDFMKWLDGPSSATWHRKGSPPGEMSDAFFTHDQREGSDTPCEDPNMGLPEDVWEEVCRLAEDVFGSDSECLVWVSNLEQ